MKDEGRKEEGGKGEAHVNGWQRWRARLGGVLLTAALAVGVPALAIRASETGEQVAIHHVHPGDTIPRICWQYKVRTDAILGANPGVSDPLAPGQRLVIPLGPGPGVAADPPAFAGAPVAAQVHAPPVRARAAIPVPEIPAPSPAPDILLAKAVVAPLSPPPPSAIERAPDALAIERPPASGQAPPAESRVGTSFLAAARELSAQGIRYSGRWTPPGEREPWMMDCSNTSRYLYRSVAGVDIGRTASDQYYFLRLKKRAWDVPAGHDHLPDIEYLKRRLQPGDLLFWENTYRPVRDPDITHVMVYLGEDADGRLQMAGSQESKGVNIYRFDPQSPKGGYSSWFGLVHHEGRFVAYGRPLDSL